MKTIEVFFMSVFVRLFSIMAQPCLPQGITFINQEQIDNFQTLFPNCTEIEGDVIISGEDITNLDGLSVLTAIGGFLWLCNNAILTDVAGLQTITSIGGALWIYDNNMLESIEGLVNITPASIGDLNIYNNSMLSHCEIANICEYLLNPGGSVIVYNNAPGCNSQGEIYGACLSVRTPEDCAGKVFTISPNPIYNSAKVEYTLNKTSIVVLQILDYSGRLVKMPLNEFQTRGEHIMAIDVSGLNPGFYFCFLRTDDRIQSLKMIKLWLYCIYN